VIVKHSPSRPVIAVSGLHRGESPQSGSAVIESLRARLPDARYIGVSFDALETGLYSCDRDQVDAAYLFPYPVAGIEELFKRLRQVHEAEHISLIVPTLDSELENLIALRPRLAGMGIKVSAPSAASLQARDKAVLGLLGERTGVSVPQTFAANSAAVLAGYAAEIGYPCYVKGALYGAHLVYNEAQLYEAYAAIHAVWGAPVLLQEAVKGEEYAIAGVGDGSGGIVVQCAIRKLLRSHLGKAFGGVVIDDPRVKDVCLRLIGELKWDGPFEIELIKPRGRPHQLFEINPRFPAWISFPAKVGCNMPAYVAAHALGLSLEALTPPPAGRMFLRHCQDIVTDIADVATISTRGTIGQPADGEPVELPAEARKTRSQVIL
jgi:carbamoyl-phosphate synthase large subunit